MRTGDVLREQIHPLARRAFYRPDARWLTFAEDAAPPLTVEAFNLNQFTEAFKLMQFGEAFGGLRRHVEKLRAAGGMDVEEFKSFLNNMIFTITVLTENMGFDAQGLDKEKFRYFDAIQQARNAEEAAGILHAFTAEAERRAGGFRPERRAGQHEETAGLHRTELCGTAQPEGSRETFSLQPVVPVQLVLRPQRRRIRRICQQDPDP